MINIAILGFGVVGSGVAQVIKDNSKTLAERLGGQELNVKYILDKRSFPDHELGDRVTMDYDKIIEDKDVLIVVETMGGSHPAYEFSKRAILAGKNVVTSNKEVVANYGAELLNLAMENNVSYLFEASVGGGIPIIRPMWQCLAANEIGSVTGILNGTTNFILTKMIEENMSFDDALALAQRNGYAEANPAADIEGLDTCRKICILASLSFGKHVYPDKVHCEGITKITADDVALAGKLGYSIKLLGRTALTDKGVYVITCPSLVAHSDPISSVNDVYNGITVCGNEVGDVMFYGRGAGKLPTASAVMADVLDIARECKNTILWNEVDEDFLCDYKDMEIRYFVVTDDMSVKAKYPDAEFASENGKLAFITDKKPEKVLDSELEGVKVISKIRVL